MRAAIIEESTSRVVNVIELEPDANWEAPAGHFVRFNENASIGMLWNGTELINE